jgi:threonyl-tRNA synthetase
MVNITLPDGQVIQLAEGSTVRNVAEHIGPGLAKAALAGRVNDTLVDLSFQLHEDAAVQLVTLKDADGLELMRHSCAHVMAEAICAIWPEARLVYGPTVQDGFYYDIDLDEPIRPTDFEQIEAKMAEIVKADMPFHAHGIDAARGPWRSSRTTNTRSTMSSGPMGM